MKGGPNIPTIVGSLPVVCFTRLDERHRARRAHESAVDSTGRKSVPYGFAICRSTDGTGYFLFTCSDDWYPISDTWHTTLDEALRHAEFEYEGTASSWEEPPPLA